MYFENIINFHFRCVSFQGYGNDRPSGIYPITLASGEEVNVFCDFSSNSAGLVWTLIESFSLENHLIYKQKPFLLNFPRNGTLQQWKDYRMSRNTMLHIKSNAILWRATCQYDTDGLVLRDVMTGYLSDTDILNLDGNRCVFAKFVNIRGISCRNCTVHLGQSSSTHAYVSSLSKARSGCEWDGRLGAVYVYVDGALQSDSYFGNYQINNPLHRCTMTGSSSTQWWLGEMLRQNKHQRHHASHWDQLSTAARFFGDQNVSVILCILNHSSNCLVLKIDSKLLMLLIILTKLVIICTTHTTPHHTIPANVMSDVHFSIFQSFFFFLCLVTWSLVAQSGVLCRNQG